MKMTLANIEDYCKRNGVLIYEKYDEADKRKRYYEMLIPVFAEGRVIPVANEKYLVKKPRDCYEHMKKLLEDDKFRANTAAWVRSWDDD